MKKKKEQHSVYTKIANAIINAVEDAYINSASVVECRATVNQEKDAINVMAVVFNDDVKGGRVDTDTVSYSMDYVINAGVRNLAVEVVDVVERAVWRAYDGEPNVWSALARRVLELDKNTTWIVGHTKNDQDKSIVRISCVICVDGELTGAHTDLTLEETGMLLLEPGRLDIHMLSMKSRATYKSKGSSK